MDDRRRWSAKENYTGLTRSQRGPRSGRIFRFGLDELTTVWVRRFVHREPFHTLSRDTLENPSSYTLAFRHAFRRRAARFTTLRLRSEDVRATGSLREHYASVLRVLGQIQEALGREHRFMGYAREFQGTPWETLGHRYEGRNVAYTICAWREQENPPVVVRRELQRAPLAEKWCAVRDTREDHPVARIGAWYDSVDDVTRRVGPTRVYVPGAHEHGVRVSKRLARTYERLSTSLSSTII